MITRYALIAALASVLGLGAALWWQSGTVDRLRDDKARLTLSLAGCTARQNNIQKDKESDAQVDNMPDLRDVPPGWLMPAPGTGGLY